MNATLVKALVPFAPVVAVFCGACALFARSRSPWSFFQVLGAAGLLIVLMTHVCEALRLFPWMYWGREGSVGHYVDLSGAVLGLVAFPTGYLVHALRTRHSA
jgi:succinate dehydrogenase/fumarate reductase cytochrome b subunit